MGLDSVALLIDVEKHFDISIPDGDAEKIFTVQEFVDCVFSKVTVNPSQKCKSQILFYRFRTYFIDKFAFGRQEFLPTQKLCDLIAMSELKATWRDIEERLAIKLPELSESDLDRGKNRTLKFVGLKFGTRTTPVTDGTIRDLVNWTLSLNHEKFINPPNLCTKADIEKIIIGIINESAGVPINEIKLEHRIVDDLGID
jgi:acyl carrier protein